MGKRILLNSLYDVNNRAQKGHPEIRILLVDSNTGFLRLTSNFLLRSLKDAVISKARNVEAALAQAEEHHPRVILLELSMPDRSGIELISRLREMLPKAGIIVLTTLDADVYRKVALAAGAEEFVAKANLTAELLPAIQKVCGEIRLQTDHRE